MKDFKGMKYIHRFDTWVNFDAVYFGSNYIQPWVSVVDEESNRDRLAYNKLNANGHGYVDLGLPSGNYWATCNVGASSPEGLGGRFAYGEVDTKQSHTQSNYKWWDASTSAMTRYGIDGDEILSFEDDVAHVIMGGDWYVPTEDDARELITYTNSAQTTVNGVTGWTFTSKSDSTKSIFLPGLGWEREGNVYNNQGQYPEFDMWVSTMNRQYSGTLMALAFRACNSYANILTTDVYSNGKYVGTPYAGYMCRGVLKLLQLK